MLSISSYQFDGETPSQIVYRGSEFGIAGTKPKVLLIGKGIQGYSHLASRIDSRGCECSFGSSSREVFVILGIQKFDLVLSPMNFDSGTLYSLIHLLEGSRTTVFYSFAVESDCWWLPALRCGQNCFGSPAFRACEFASHLDETIRTIQRDGPSAAEGESQTVFRADTPFMASSLQRTEFIAANSVLLGRQRQVKREAVGYLLKS